MLPLSGQAQNCMRLLPQGTGLLIALIAYQDQGGHRRRLVQLWNLTVFSIQLLAGHHQHKQVSEFKTESVVQFITKSLISCFWPVGERPAFLNKTCFEISSCTTKILLRFPWTRQTKYVLRRPVHVQQKSYDDLPEPLNKTGFAKADFFFTDNKEYMHA